MKVLHLITGLGPGGAEHMLARTLPGLRGEHVVVSLTNDNFWGSTLQHAGIKVFFLGLRGLNLPTVTFRLLHLLREEKPDIINTYLLHTNLYGRFIGKLFGKKVVCSVRNIHRDRQFLNLLDRLTSWLVDYYTPNSKAVAEFNKELGIPESKIVIIPNGVDITEFAKAKKSALHWQKPLYLCVASFKKQKNHETLVKAFAQTQKGSLILVGEGVEKERIKRLVTHLDLKKRVHFLGVQKNIPRLLRAADFLVLPSRHEGMPNILLEAMAAKTPIICSAIPENLELVGKDATLFSPGDVENLANALKCAKPNQKQQARLFEQVKRYSIERTRQLMESLYQKLSKEQCEKNNKHRRTKRVQP